MTNYTPSWDISLPEKIPGTFTLHDSAYPHLAHMLFKGEPQNWLWPKGPLQQTLLWAWVTPESSPAAQGLWGSFSHTFGHDSLRFLDCLSSILLFTIMAAAQRAHCRRITWTTVPTPGLTLWFAWLAIWESHVLLSRSFKSNCVAGHLLSFSAIKGAVLCGLFHQPVPQWKGLRTGLQPKYSEHGGPARDVLLLLQATEISGSCVAVE